MLSKENGCPKEKLETPQLIEGLSDFPHWMNLAK
jgi:hypothetical protein